MKNISGPLLLEVLEWKKTCGPHIKQCFIYGSALNQHFIAFWIRIGSHITNPDTDTEEEKVYIIRIYVK
jgi:hypothetical protein